MIYLPVSIVSLQATENINGEMSILSTQEKNYWEKLPKELIPYIIDTPYYERDRFLMTCALRTVSKDLYLKTAVYFNTSFKKVLAYDYLNEQDATFLKNFNLNNSFFQEFIIFTTEFPGICIKTKIHFGIDRQQWWHLYFSTQKSIINLTDDKTKNYIKLLSEALKIDPTIHCTFDKPEELTRYRNKTKFLKKMVCLCNKSSQDKKNVSKNILSFSKYFPENHRNLYGKIKKIIKWNKKGQPFGVSVFKIFVRYVCFREQALNTALLNCLDHFGFFYQKKNSSQKEILCKNKPLLKKYVFELFNNYPHIAYDLLFPSYAKRRLEDFILLNGFLEVAAYKATAEKIFKSDLFKQIWSYYLPKLNEPQKNPTNCQGFCYKIQRLALKINLSTLNFIINNKIIFEIVYQKTTKALPIMDLMPQSLNYTLCITQDPLLPISKKSDNLQKNPESKSLFYKIIKNIFLTFSTAIDYIIRFFNFIGIF